MPSAHRTHRVLWVAALGLLTTLFHGCQPSGAEMYEDGKRLVAAGRYNDAIDKLTEASRMGGGLAENPALLNLVGYSYHQIGELEAAEVAYKNAARFEEQKSMRIPELRVNWARLYLDQSEPESAIALLEEAALYQPESVEIALLLAEGYRKQLVRAANPNEIAALKGNAINTLRSALNYKPSSEKDRVYHAMSLVYLAAGDLRQALDNAQRALQENASNDEARWSFAMLSQALLPTISDGAREQATKQAIERFEDYIEKGASEDRIAEAKTIVDQMRRPEEAPASREPTADGPLVAESSNSEGEPIEIDLPDEDAPSDDMANLESEGASAQVEIPAGEGEGTVEIVEADEVDANIEIDAPDAQKDPNEEFPQEFANADEPNVDASGTNVADSSEAAGATQEDLDDNTARDVPSETAMADSTEVASTSGAETALEETPAVEPKPIDVSGDAEVATREAPPPVDTLPREEFTTSPSWTTPEITAPEPLTPEEKRRAAYAAFRDGAAAQKQGAYARAIEAYNRALVHDGDFYECLFNKGYCAYQNKDYQAAAQSYAAALRIQPQATNTRRNYIVALLRLNSFQEALRQAQTWLRQDPQSAEAHLIAAKLYLDKFQNTASARRHYETYLALNPTSPDSQEIRAWLNRSYAANSQ